MDIRQPTEKEMIEGIAKGFCDFLSNQQYIPITPLSKDKIWEAIKIGIRDAFDGKDISNILKG